MFNIINNIYRNMNGSGIERFDILLYTSRPLKNGTFKDEFYLTVIQKKTSTYNKNYLSCTACSGTIIFRLPLSRSFFSQNESIERSFSRYVQINMP